VTRFLRKQNLPYRGEVLKAKFSEIQNQIREKKFKGEIAVVLEGKTDI
jgi:hypothetical protein